MKTVVCLPVYNEEESLQDMIDQIREVGFDLFVVDEHSKDKTLEIAEKNRVPVYQRDGSGKGWGVRKAVEVAKKMGYDNLALIDCDCTYPPKYIPELLKYLPEYDMAIGKRAISDIPRLNRLPNKFFNFLINMLFLSSLKDVNSGLRVIKLDQIPDLDAEKFDIEAQITIRALKKGLRIKEIPIEYLERKGKPKVRVKDGLVILFRIIRERFQ
ncbi:MAG: hypothetical protein A3H42_06910 [Deltaproteobacteria bacterium RIFCSPLOWO2_02_FULL_46_8]|nr:MAG: hypothetical protein A3H42_06910 [Deltaproteobacteria bacterium RIFCSPLOWO2_02_FULL_46_8]